MRPVIRGTAPNNYSHWGQARNDLAAKIGWYCSYCEMGVTNMIEVEHIVPRDHQGAPLDWNNFLLSCKYCNTVKSNNNVGTDGYVWPDRDNTDLTFNYSQLNVIEPVNNGVRTEAQATIDLMGLDRRPGGRRRPTQADSRWIHRLEAWLAARRSLKNWNGTPSPAMADQIALTAKGHGFYSVWMNVFKDIPDVLDAIRNEFPNTYNNIDVSGTRILRAGGII
jgi:hypothetical protein